jgi:hypothetical protein
MNGTPIDPMFWQRPLICILASLAAMVLVALMLVASIVILLW